MRAARYRLTGWPVGSTLVGNAERVAARRTGRMDLWNHCENPYPFVPAEVLEQAESVRASLPNKYCDPAIAARLYDEVFEEYELCDELGINIVTNEHHAGINNLFAANPMITGIVARITKKVRILSLGTLVTVRPGPRGRGVRDRRRALQGSARDWLRQVRWQRDGLRRREPDRAARARVGSDRPDREGADLPRRAVQLGGEVLRPSP